MSSRLGLLTLFNGSGSRRLSICTMDAGGHYAVRDFQEEDGLLLSGGQWSFVLIDDAYGTESCGADCVAVMLNEFDIPNPPGIVVIAKAYVDLLPLQSGSLAEKAANLISDFPEAEILGVISSYPDDCRGPLFPRGSYILDGAVMLGEDDSGRYVDAIPDKTRACARLFRYAASSGCLPREKCPEYASWHMEKFIEDYLCHVDKISMGRIKVPRELLPPWTDIDWNAFALADAVLPQAVRGFDLEAEKVGALQERFALAWASLEEFEWISDAWEESPRIRSRNYPKDVMVSALEALGALDAFLDFAEKDDTRASHAGRILARVLDENLPVNIKSMEDVFSEEWVLDPFPGQSGISISFPEWGHADIQAASRLASRFDGLVFPDIDDVDDIIDHIGGALAASDIYMHMDIDDGRAASIETLLPDDGWSVFVIDEDTLPERFPHGRTSGFASLAGCAQAIGSIPEGFGRCLVMGKKTACDLEDEIEASIEAGESVVVYDASGKFGDTDAVLASALDGYDNDLMAWCLKKGTLPAGIDTAKIKQSLLRLRFSEDNRNTHRNISVDLRLGQCLAMGKLEFDIPAWLGDDTWIRASHDGNALALACSKLDLFPEDVDIIENAKIIAELGKLWKNVLEPMGLDIYADGKPEGLALLRALGDAAGMESFVEAYLAGVSMDDIIGR